jgi:hypothetical protein
VGELVDHVGDAGALQGDDRRGATLSLSPAHRCDDPQPIVRFNAAAISSMA